MWEPKNIQAVRNYKRIISHVPRGEYATASEIWVGLDLSENVIRRYLGYALRQGVIECEVKRGTAYYRQLQRSVVSTVEVMP